MVTRTSVLCFLVYLLETFTAQALSSAIVGGLPVSIKRFDLGTNNRDEKYLYKTVFYFFIFTWLGRYALDYSFIDFYKPIQSNT